MKFNKLLKKLKLYIDADAEQLQQEDKGLSTVLKKLKKKEDHLKARVAAESDDEERELLVQELNIVHSQRKKGIKLLARMRKEEKP